MLKRICLAALLCAAPAPILAHLEPATPAEAPKDDLVRVVLETDAGRIVIAVDRGRAPITAKNFLAYVDSGKFNGETFYRAMPLTGGGLVQAGITSDGRKLGKAITHEPPSATGLRHVKGAVSMAATAPGAAQSDFFILTTDVPSFDAHFAPFGRVVEGMDVVEKILTSPVSQTKGEGPMRGQMLEPAVKIRSAKRAP
jgi:peptidyl-prolyl cis-trans isomerase A (cyclophilin A)